MPAVCNDQTKFYNYEGKGKLSRRQRLAEVAVRIDRQEGRRVRGGPPATS